MLLLGQQAQIFIRNFVFHLSHNIISQKRNILYVTGFPHSCDCLYKMAELKTFDITVHSHLKSLTSHKGIHITIIANQFYQRLCPHLYHFSTVKEFAPKNKFDTYNYYQFSLR